MCICGLKRTIFRNGTLKSSINTGRYTADYLWCGNLPYPHVPWFRVVFEMTDGSLMEFQMQQGDFRELEKGDRGMLTYQGNRYICYQKYKFKSEAQEEEKC